jgi:hypothetical protein
VEAMRLRFDPENLPWYLLKWTGRDGHQVFFADLPTQRERALFARTFAAEYHALWEFYSGSCDEFLNSSMYEVRGIFRHPKDEFLEMIRRDPPKVPFDPPEDDMSDLSLQEKYRVLARARGLWWEACGYPMTEREKEWLTLNRDAQPEPRVETDSKVVELKPRNS